MPRRPWGRSRVLEKPETIKTVSKDTFFKVVFLTIAGVVSADLLVWRWS